MQLPPSLYTPLYDGAVFGGREDGQVIGSDDQARNGELVAPQNSNVSGSWGLDLQRQRLGHCSRSHEVTAQLEPTYPTQRKPEPKATR